MRKVLLVLVREYLANVRTKAFLVGIVLTPLWFGLIFLMPQLARGQEASHQRVVVVDSTGILADPVAKRLEDLRTLRKDEPVFDVERRKEVGDLEALKREVSEGELFAVLLDDAVLAKKRDATGSPPESILVPDSVPGGEAAKKIQGVVNAIVNERVMAERGISEEDAKLLARDAIAPLQLSRGGRVGGGLQAVLPLMAMIILYFGIVGISQILVNSTIEEKSNRVYELLLSSISPTQLMAGKVLGICLVGFTLLLLWTGGGLLAASLQGLGGLTTSGQLGLFLVYYILGFLLIASLMVAVGSACNTQKEAQNLMAPLSVLLAMPLILSVIVLRAPNGPLATITSFIPPFTPFIMMARVSAVPGPPAWEIAASVLLLLLATAAAIHVAGRVFRVGILMVGKPPSLREILRWVREA